MFEDQHFKDHQKEARIFKMRMVLMLFIMLLLFAALLVRYYDLQIVHYLDYVTQSEHNRVHVEPIPPTRGIIYDSKGVVIADNRPSYTLSIIFNKSIDLEATLALIKTLIPLSPAELEKFYKAKKQQVHPLEPIPLKYQLTDEEIALLAVNEYRLDGVQVDAELVRYYPQGDLFAHTVGYVSRINETELLKFSEEDIRRYSGTYAIGKVGIESSYEAELLGNVGSQNVETNARGRIQRVLNRIDPLQGKNITLHLDAGLQETAAAALAGRRGAVVAIEVKTGAIVAAVSNPGFDPNLFVTGISYNDYKALNESPDTPLMNRILQGQYPPGSTLKPLVGLAGLQYGVTDEHRSVADPGFFILPGNSRPYRDWKKGGHGGRVSIKQAIAESCDVYFYDLGSRLGIDRLNEFGKHFGLGQFTQVDIPHERKGVWPSPAWKRSVKKLAWYPGDTVNMSIGQGFVLATPLQLAVMTATIANRGVRMRPQLVKAIDDQPVAPVIEETMAVSGKNWDIVFDGMAEVMRPEGHGTGRASSKNAGYTIAGKTGSAQVISYAQNIKYDDDILKAMLEKQRDHALFIAFAPLEDPQIAIAVMVENALHGASQAGPVVRYVFDGYLRGKYLKRNEPLPVIGEPLLPTPAQKLVPEPLLDELEEHDSSVDDSPLDNLDDYAR
jgi:penicillin-binding protein 2